MRFLTCINVIAFTLSLAIPALPVDSASVAVDSASVAVDSASVAVDSASVANDSAPVANDSAPVANDSSFISMAGDCRYPAIASNGKNMYMIWLLAEGNRSALLFKKSSDEGATWTSARTISNNNSDCFPPTIAVSGNVVHASWIDFGETIDGEIYYARSLDNGETWEKNYIVAGNANSARYPLLACSGDNVYLIWQDVENKVFFRCSHDRGTTWESEVMLGKVGKHSCYCFPPAIAAAGNQLSVVWTDYREDRKGFRVSLYGLPVFKMNDKRASTPFNNNSHMISSVVCRKSTDNGRTWGKEIVFAATRVSRETQDEIDNPTMFSDGSLSYIFWLDKRNLPLGEIFYSRFDPQTQKGLLTGKNLFPNQKRSPKRPSAAIDKKNSIHLAWASFFGGQSVIHYGAINAAGNSIIEKKDLTTAKCRFHNPVIQTTPSGLLHVFWFDEPKDKNEWSKIFLKTSRDNGTTWEYWGSQKKDR
jgi:Neuraminidase (sialidase)